MESISVIGLGKLGLPLAVCLASRGFDVLGIDKDAEKIANLNNGILNSTEPGLQNHYYRGKDNITFSTDVAEAVRQTDTTFIIVGTPSNSRGEFSTCQLDQVIVEMATELQKTKDTHLFIIGSTVMPGTCKKVEQALMEMIGSYRFGLCYCPELVALGDCCNGFMNPDVVVIGENHQAGGHFADKIYSLLSPAAPRVHLSLTEAEIFKVALNFFLTTKISFANTLAGICESFPGADVDRVTKAIGMDSRISPKFLKGGLAFGGFCFPRDVAAFNALCSHTQQSKALPWAVRAVNEYQKTRLYGMVCEAGDGPVSVLGLSFKPGTPEIEASPAVDLVDKLVADGREVRIYDSKALPNAYPRWDKKVKMFTTRGLRFTDGDIVVIATDDPLWKQLGLGRIHEGVTVIDCWRCLSDEVKNAPHITYRALGVGSGG